MQAWWTSRYGTMENYHRFNAPDSSNGPHPDELYNTYTSLVPANPYLETHHDKPLPKLPNLEYLEHKQKRRSLMQAVHTPQHEEKRVSSFVARRSTVIENNSHRVEFLSNLLGAPKICYECGKSCTLYMEKQVPVTDHCDIEDLLDDSNSESSYNYDRDTAGSLSESSSGTSVFDKAVSETTWSSVGSEMATVVVCEEHCRKAAQAVSCTDSEIGNSSEEEDPMAVFYSST